MSNNHASAIVPCPSGSVPMPTYGSAVVDGFYNDDWDLTQDFFANMYIAGDSNKALMSKSYLKYAPSTKTVYVLVLTEAGIPALKQPNDAWVKIDGTTGNVVDGNSENFKWVYNDEFPENSGYAKGYEASFNLNPSSYPATYGIRIHIEVYYNNGAQTSATTPANVWINLCINPPPENPSISIEKLTNGQDGPVVLAGSTVNWSYKVTNTGDVELYSIAVTDNLEGNIGVILSLGRNEFNILYNTGTAVVGQYENVGIATGTSQQGTSVTDDDSSSYFGAAPSIKITKNISVDGGNTWHHTDEDSYPEVLVDSEVQYQFVVENNGNVDLQNVTISDSNPIFNVTIGTLAAGATYILSQSEGSPIQVSAQYGLNTNTATVTGHFIDFNGIDHEYSNYDTAFYFGAAPSIKITKNISVDGGNTWHHTDEDSYPEVLVDSEVRYQFVVENNGNVDLQSVTISDSNPIFNVTIGTLAAGATYILSQSGGYPIEVSAQYGLNTNTATVTGHFIDFNGIDNEYSNDDTAFYFGAAPSIKITKNVSVDGGETWLNANEEPFPLILVGNNVEYQFVVKNNGNVDLQNVTISESDSMLTFTQYIGTLAAGVSYTFPSPYDPSITVPAQPGIHTNTGTVFGFFTDFNGTEHQYNDSDPASYFGANPSINIIKNISIDGGINWLHANEEPFPQVLVGSNVQYQFIVKNTGNVDLEGVTINDPTLHVNAYIGTLAVGNSYTFPSNSDSPIIIPASYGLNTNIATALGFFKNNVYTDTDSASYFGTLLTYTKGGYQGNGYPGQLLINYFSTSFPSGLIIGQNPYDNKSPYGLLWTNVTNLRSFLVTGGSSGALTKDVKNPITSNKNGGTLATQVATLTINITFSNQNILPAGLGNLKYVNTNDILNGDTIYTILTVANTALATGKLPNGYTFGTLNTLITNINEAFDNGVATTWAQEHLVV